MHAARQAASHERFANALYLIQIRWEFYQHLRRPMIELRIHWKIKRGQRLQQFLQKLRFRCNTEGDQFALPSKQGGLIG